MTLIELLSLHPRAGVLELSRRAGVARATVTARLSHLEASGAVTGYPPQVELAACGLPVQAFVTLEIAQGRLDEVRRHLEQIPGVLEAYAITGAGDVWCRLAAGSNEALQDLLLDLDRSVAVRRSTSVIVLSRVVAPRVLPLLRSRRRQPARRTGPGRSGVPVPPAPAAHAPGASRAGLPDTA